MRRFLSIWVGFLVATVPFFASALPGESCVDLEQRVTEPLRPPPPLSRGKIVEVSGIRREGEKTIHWQGARGWVPVSMRDASAWILDHTKWKEMEKTKLEVKELSRPGFEAFHEVHQDTRVFAFIRIQWVENWAYAVLAGSLAVPKRLLTTYQKSDGTFHIRRLCGSVDFKADGIGTDAYFYQEADADHYEVQHIEELHRRFFATLGAGRAGASFSVTEGK